MNTIKIDSKQAKMIAHRGLSGLERENTCPAFVAAGNRSYFGIETDVHITKDGKFVIIHDETTDRVSLGQSSINVEENDYAAVSGLVLPDLDQTTNRQDIRIPLLADYINICKKYDKVCVLELKNAFPEECIKKIIQEIQSLGYIEKLLTGDEVTSEMIDTLVQNKLNLDIYYKRLSKENVNQIHSRGIKVNCWTCDDKADADELIEMGVDFITTNILE